MIPPMRRKSREMDEKTGYALLEKAEYGILSTTNEENQPFGTPLSYIVFENTIYFHSALKGAKINNMRHNSKVCFTIVGNTQPTFDNHEFSTYYESVMAFGTAFEVTEKEKKEKILELLCMKYLPQFASEIPSEINREIRATGIWGISIEHLSCKVKNTP